jgi:hypothetical protein
MKKMMKTEKFTRHWDSLDFFQQIWFKDTSTAEIFVVAIEQEGIIHEKNLSNNLKITKN